MADQRLAPIPVVVLSAEHAHRLGLRAVLQKPADPMRLIGTLERWCDGRQELSVVGKA